jgi:hypothetical protein
MISARFRFVALASGAALALALSLARVGAQQPASGINVDPDDIGGVVSSSKGPEAGVWVIAETTDLPTRFSKTVVTDDRGRYLVPDLPAANYNVWVRGYGLIDSAKVQSRPGRVLNLTATLAPNPKAAAQYYPGNYWFSMINIPGKNEFPGTGPKGNGISPGIKSQAQWIRQMKTDGCEACHQLGNKGTREIPAALGKFDSHALAWERRVQSGQAGQQMLGQLNAMGKERATAMFGDWTSRIEKGELPPAPPRPQGAERNVVITQWDWASPTAYLHDEISTDKRNPTLNPNGLIYGSPELSTDWVPVLDPVKNTISRITMPVRDPNTPNISGKVLKPSPYWGEEAIWDSKTNMHNPMMDQKGRVWFTSAMRPADNPAYCKEGSNHPSAKLTPVNNSGRQLAVYDPKTKKIDLISTCFSTHHLLFAEDANYTLWTSSGGGGGVVGWLNTKMWDETHDEEKSQGWTALILDSNGNGRRDPEDKRYNGAFYGLAVEPNGMVWGTILGFPGAIARIAPGANPPATALTEVYEIPWNNPKASVQGYSPRGLDVDRNGVVWTVLSSGHFASFDRRKCKGPLNGPAATGQHCPEGWTLYPMPGPNFKNADSGSVDSNYYDWVDQFDTLGMGKNVPIATGNGSDSLLVLTDGKFTVLRVPYPTGFFAKGLDGRIDDPKAGWKGKGVWTTWGTRTPFHSDTGKGSMPKVVKFQMRPDPLAR